MRVYMQTRPGDASPPRYYQLLLQPDLLGGWLLVREWGQPGGHRGSRREVFLDRQAAVGAFEQARDAQLKRGFSVMFARGFDDPHKA